MGNVKEEQPNGHGTPTRNKQTSKLLLLLAALAVAALALFFILRNRNHSDEETLQSPSKTEIQMDNEPENKTENPIETL